MMPSLFWVAPLRSPGWPDRLGNRKHHLKWDIFSTWLLAPEVEIILAPSIGRVSAARRISYGSKWNESGAEEEEEK